MSENPSAGPVAIGPNISVVGDSCSGKTTVAVALAERLGLRHVELDSLSWQPNWTPTPDDVFLEQVHEAVVESGWVIDGNYGRIVRPIVSPARHPPPHACALVPSLENAGAPLGHEP